MKTKNNSEFIITHYNDNGTVRKVIIEKNDILRIWEHADKITIYLKSKASQVQSYIIISDTINNIIEQL